MEIGKHLHVAGSFCHKLMLHASYPNVSFFSALPVSYWAGYFATATVGYHAFWLATLPHDHLSQQQLSSNSATFCVVIRSALIIIPSLLVALHEGVTQLSHFLVQFN